MWDPFEQEAERVLNSAGLAGNCFNTSKMRKFSAINKENKDINNYAGIQPSVKVFSLSRWFEDELSLLHNSFLSGWRRGKSAALARHAVLPQLQNNGGHGCPPLITQKPLRRPAGSTFRTTPRWHSAGDTGWSKCPPCSTTPGVCPLPPAALYPAPGCGRHSQSC